MIKIIYAAVLVAAVVGRLVESHPRPQAVDDGWRIYERHQQEHPLETSRKGQFRPSSDSWSRIADPFLTELQSMISRIGNRGQKPIAPPTIPVGDGDKQHKRKAGSSERVLFEDEYPHSGTQDGSNVRFPGEHHHSKGHHHQQQQQQHHGQPVRGPVKAADHKGGHFENETLTEPDQSVVVSPILDITPCESDYYCESADDYPQEAITKMVESNQNLVITFVDHYKEATEYEIRKASANKVHSSPMSQDANSETINRNASPSPRPDIRISAAKKPFTTVAPPSFDREESMCESINGYIFPKKAKSVNNQWLYVVNTENVTQGVWTEKCTNANEECAFADMFPMGYKSFCKQKYSEYKLMTMDEEGRPSFNTFRFPSCCSCHYKTALMSRDVIAGKPQVFAQPASTPAQ